LPTRYIISAGAITMYGSQVLFWSVPPANITEQELPLAWPVFGIFATALALHGLNLLGDAYAKALSEGS
jgi:hypothetical protein